MPRLEDVPGLPWTEGVAMSVVTGLALGYRGPWGPAKSPMGRL